MGTLAKKTKKMDFRVVRTTSGRVARCSGSLGSPADKAQGESGWGRPSPSGVGTGLPRGGSASPEGAKATLRVSSSALAVQAVKAWAKPARDLSCRANRGK